MHFSIFRFIVSQIVSGFTIMEIGINGRYESALFGFTKSVNSIVFNVCFLNFKFR